MSRSSQLSGNVTILELLGHHVKDVLGDPANYDIYILFIVNKISY